MALIKCTECGKEISDKAVTCPNCGAPVNTESTSNEASTVSYSPIPPEPEKKKKKEKKKGGCLVTLLRVAGIFVGVIIILNIVFGGSESSSETAVKTGEVETTSNNKADTEDTVNAVSDSESEEPDNVFKVGDIVEAKDCTITFLSAGEYDTGNEYIQPKDGYVYYQMEFEFENTGKSDLALSSMIGWTCYADNYKIDQTWIGDENGLDGSVSPGRKTKGSVYFEVPADAETIDLEYETNFWTENKIYFVVK